MIAVFVIFCVVSFIGSLQPGPVNMLVMHESAQYRYRQALAVAVGGSWPEMLYTSGALGGISIVSTDFFSSRYLQLITGCVLLLAACIIAAQKPSEKTRSTKIHRGFITGSILGLGNPQLLVFWSLIGIQLKQLFPELHLHVGVASAGAAIGAFMLHVLLIGMVHRFQSQSAIGYVRTKGNLVIGCVCAALGIVTIIKALW